MSGIEQIIEAVKADLKQRLSHQRKTQRDKLAILVGTMLQIRSANLNELAAGLPRNVERTDMRYQWIARFLGNEHVDCDAIMEPFAKQVIELSSASGTPVTLIMDQSKVSDRHQVLMLAVRCGERALPLGWRVEMTEGNIGFETQQVLLDSVAPWIPQGAAVTLMGDRFYGSPDLIGWCQKQKWDYRLRLKGNLTLRVKGRKTTTADCAKNKIFYLEDVELTARRVTTNIGIIHDPGHEEPWIIAMSDTPGYLKTLDYSKRWGIEPMFSDFKSRGFGLEESQIRYPERLARLILVMAIAVYWTVSTGQWDSQHNKSPCEQRPIKRQPKKVERSKVSLFTRGLRWILKTLHACIHLPKLWEAWPKPELKAASGLPFG